MCMLCDVLIIRQGYHILRCSFGCNVARLWRDCFRICLCAVVHDTENCKVILGRQRVLFYCSAYTTKQRWSDKSVQNEAVCSKSDGLLGDHQTSWPIFVYSKWHWWDSKSLPMYTLSNFLIHFFFFFFLIFQAWNELMLVEQHFTADVNIIEIRIEYLIIRSMKWTDINGLNSISLPM